MCMSTYFTLTTKPQVASNNAPRGPRLRGRRVDQSHGRCVSGGQRFSGRVWRDCVCLGNSGSLRPSPAGTCLPDRGHLAPIWCTPCPPILLDAGSLRVRTVLTPSTQTCAPKRMCAGLSPKTQPVPIGSLCCPWCRAGCGPRLCCSPLTTT